MRFSITCFSLKYLKLKIFVQLDHMKTQTQTQREYFSSLKIMGVPAKKIIDLKFFLGGAK
ncbi:hypothetical protein CKA32_004892 [Geitlerinema sp. FC II]|nr:hypothetical protein CKA32_004892 [Geitlerinema sp. FC II]